jgi:DNA-directed RNA polymerase subunit RPC12/RpoP
VKKCTKHWQTRRLQMRIGEFLLEIGELPADWDEWLACASCGAPILELHSRGAEPRPLTIERVRWYDDRTASDDEEIVCPRCGSRSPIARPHMRDPLPVAA